MAPSKMGARLRPVPKPDGVAKKGLTKGKMVCNAGSLNDDRAGVWVTSTLKN
jgi:hypothetical protein